MRPKIYQLLLLMLIALFCSCTTTQNQNGVIIRQKKSLWDMVGGFIIMNESGNAENNTCSESGK